MSTNIDNINKTLLDTKSNNFINFVNYVKKYFSNINKQHSDNCKCKFNYELDMIQEIESIPVNIIIEYNRQNNFTFSLKIYHKKIIYDKNLEHLILYNTEIQQNIKNITYSVISKIILKIFTIISKLKFCKFIGKFVENNISTYNDKQFIEFHFISELNISTLKLSCDECCVCYDKVVTKTACKHYLCVPCWSKLQKLCCPLCKKGITYFKHNNDYEDEEYDEDDENEIYYSDSDYSESNVL